MHLSWVASVALSRRIMLGYVFEPSIDHAEAYDVSFGCWLVGHHLFGRDFGGIPGWDGA